MSLPDVEDGKVRRECSRTLHIFKHYSYSYLPITSAMLLSFRTLWYSHKLRTILQNWREFCQKKSDENSSIICCIQDLSPEGIATVFVDHLAVATTTSNPPVFPHWLPISMSCRAVLSVNMLRPGTCLLMHTAGFLSLLWIHSASANR